MTAFTFRPAVREAVGIVIGVAGPSGSGKTFSAMRLAAGIAGDKPFAVIDTEARRALHYADRFRFDHGDLKPPFRPQAYADAIHAADSSGYPVIVVDSMSHEHAGEGGLLDWHEEELDRMAGDDWKKRDAMNLAAWARVKGAHKQMVSKLLQVRAHLILAFRAEQKIELVRQDGKLQIVPKKIASGFSDWIPIAEKNLLYELTASFLLTPDAPGVPKPIKLQEQHRALFPLDQPISESAGEHLAAWARGATTRPVPSDQPEDRKKLVMAEIIRHLTGLPSNAARARVAQLAFGVATRAEIEQLPLDRLEAALAEAAGPSRLEQEIIRWREEHEKSA